MIVQRAIGFIRSFYVCEVLPPDEVGRWDLSFNFLMLAAPLAVLGIPGSFGRYIARYEESGQVSRFFRNSVCVCLLLTALFCLGFWSFDQSLARYFLGEASDDALARLLAVGLPAVVFFNFAISWFTGRRLNRYVFRIQFVQTLFFALLCVMFFAFRGPSAESVIAAYLGSCVIGLLLSIGYRSASSESADANVEGSIPIWRTVMPFAISAWAGDALMNLFALCDRILLVNFHPDAGIESQFLVGQYHTACIFPLLLMTVGAMAASTALPYLSKDWEAGKADEVGSRVNLMLKVVGAICVAASAAILLLAPVLFGQLWKDKFSIGESLLPMTLAFCSLAAMGYLVQSFFWCIEKAWLGSVFLFVGLITNAVLGIVLVRFFGIHGVVASTFAAHAVVLTVALTYSYRRGLPFDSGVVFIGLLIPVICFGKWFAAAAFVGMILLTGCTDRIIDQETKQESIDRVRGLLRRMLSSRPAVS